MLPGPPARRHSQAAARSLRLYPNRVVLADFRQALWRGHAYMSSREDEVLPLIPSRDRIAVSAERLSFSNACLRKGLAVPLLFSDIVRRRSSSHDQPLGPQARPTASRLGA